MFTEYMNELNPKKLALILSWLQVLCCLGFIFLSWKPVMRHHDVTCPAQWLSVPSVFQNGRPFVACSGPGTALGRYLTEWSSAELS